MATPKSPCYGCERRQLLCHCSCDDYAMFKRAMDDYNAIVNKAKDEFRNIRDYEIRNKCKRR